jgi:hypothetical protein
MRGAWIQREPAAAATAAAAAPAAGAHSRIATGSSSRDCVSLCAWQGAFASVIMGTCLTLGAISMTHYLSNQSESSQRVRSCCCCCCCCCCCPLRCISCPPRADYSSSPASCPHISSTQRFRGAFQCAVFFGTFVVLWMLLVLLDL